MSVDSLSNKDQQKKNNKRVNSVLMQPSQSHLSLSYSKDDITRGSMKLNSKRSHQIIPSFDDRFHKTFNKIHITSTVVQPRNNMVIIHSKSPSIPPISKNLSVR